MKNTKLKIAERIKEKRIEKGYSQKELGELIGFAQNTVAGYETGVVFPSLETVVKLANIFDTTTDYLLGRVDFE